jgi:hypothetical protein
MPTPLRSSTSYSTHRANRVTQRHYAVHVLVSIGLVLLTACQTDVNGPIEPTSAILESGAVVTVHEPSRDALAQRLPNTPGACIVAVRTPEGHYRSRSITVSVSAVTTANSHPSASSTRFAYRGWSAGLPEPTVLAVCTMPEAPTARAHFARFFKSTPMDANELRSFAQSVGVLGVQEWGPWTSPHVMQGAGPVHMTDGLASELLTTAPMSTTVLPMLATSVSECDPDYPADWCEEETVSDTPPPSEGPDTAPITDPNVTIPCTALTEYPHKSTTPGFIGRINAKSRNECPQPLPQFVSSTLKRQKCFLWVFCTWPAIAYGTDTRASSTWAEAKANTDCAWEKGWYMGVGYHQTTWPNGVAATTTWSPAVRIHCW